MRSRRVRRTTFQIKNLPLENKSWSLCRFGIVQIIKFERTPKVTQVTSYSIQTAQCRNDLISFWFVIPHRWRTSNSLFCSVSHEQKVVSMWDCAIFSSTAPRKAITQDGGFSQNELFSNMSCMLPRTLFETFSAICSLFFQMPRSKKD